MDRTSLLDCSDSRISDDAVGADLERMLECASPQANGILR